MKKVLKKTITAVLILVMAVVFMPGLKVESAYAFDTYNPDKYTPGDNLAVSKFQSKFKIENPFMRST